MPPCKYFQLGNCRRGDSCYYSHQLPLGTIPTSAISFSLDRQAPLAAASSKDTNSRADLPSSNPILSISDSRKTISCRFFAQGRCRNGGSCPYSHPSVNEGTPPELTGLRLDDGRASSQLGDCDSLKRTHHKGAAKSNEYTRELGGALVEFGDGFRIQKLSLPGDFSSVRVNGLPRHSTVQDVVKCLADMGFKVDGSSIRVTTGSDAAHSSADIRVEDPTFATRLCQKVGRAGTAHNPEMMALLEAIEVPVKLTFGSSSQIMDCRSVLCSWHKPTRTVWMNFGNGDIAQRVMERFNTGVYRIPFHKVACKGPTRGDGIHNRQAWTVVMNEAPGDANEATINLAIKQARDKPRHIEFGKPSYISTSHEAEGKVRQLLERFGDLESFERVEDVDSKRVKVKARFLREADMMDAVRELNNKELSFSRGKLSIQSLYSTKINVRTDIYNAVKEDISCEMARWQQYHIHLNVYPPSDTTKRYTAMKMSGQDSKQMAQAKNSLLTILNGFPVRKGDALVWSNTFNDPVTLRRFKELEDSFGVLIVRDRHGSCIRLYGNSQGRERAENSIVDMVSTPPTTKHTIELSPDQFRIAIKSGYQRARSLLGEDTVALELSGPKRLIVTGSLRDYHVVQRILNHSDKEGETEVEEEGICAICWTAAESPYMTNCGHVYCLDCFENLCRASSSGTEEDLVCCEGGGGKCRAVFALDELQDSIASTIFEECLRSSFTRYVRRRPQHYQYCPTADCDHIYRVGDPLQSPRTHRCSKCFTSICTTCREGHAAMTCAEFKDLKSGGFGATEKLKKQLGFKDCPACKTTMEKTEGCNHMTCRGCGIHICWVCLATFQEGGPCYEHMNRAHGGIGVRIPALLLDDWL